MKKIKRIFSIILMMALLASILPKLSLRVQATEVANGTCGEDLKWYFYDDGSLIISGSGTMLNYSHEMNEINDVAPWFDYKDSITSVIIEEGVTSIGSAAFKDCENIVSIKLPESLSEDTRAIGVGAFQGCTSLAEINIPDSVNVIGAYAFQNCKSLKQIDLPNTIIYIFRNAFAYSGLTSITIPDTEHFIDLGHNVFYECNDLKEAIIGKGTSGINERCFLGCSNLETVIFRGEAPDVGSNNTFAFTSAKAYYPANDTSWTETTRNLIGGSYLTTWIPYCVDEAHAWTEANCTDPKRCELCGETTGDALGHNYVDNICQRCGDVCETHSFDEGGTCSNCGFFGGESAKYGGVCGTGLTWILDINGTLTVSGSGQMDQYESASQTPWYSYMSEIRFVNIESEVLTIGNFAFADCSNLATALLPAGLETIGSSAFKNCTGLGSVEIAENWNNDYLLTIGNNAFENCESLTFLTIPYQVACIEDNAFKGCKSLINVCVNGQLSGLGEGAFWGCSSLESCSIYGLPRIEAYTFKDCISLTNAPTSPFIGDEAFEGCTELTEIVFNSDVTNIGSEAYSGCKSISKIVFLGDAPTIGTNAFEHVIATAYYPAMDTWTESVRQSYGGTLNWQSHSCHLWEHDWEVTNSQEPTCSSDGYVDSVCKICGCTNSEWKPSLDHPYTTTNTKEASCTVDGEITYSCPDCNDTYTESIPATGHTISGSVCSSCGETFNWPISGTCDENLNWTLTQNGVLTISGNGAIGGEATDNGRPWYPYRASISSLVIDEGVTGVGSGSFKNLYNLVSVSIGSGVEKLNAMAFQDCVSLTTITIPRNVTYIGSDSFWRCSSLESVILENGVEQIGNRAFMDCTALKEVSIPDSVTELGSYAFSQCTALTSVDLGSSITNIGAVAFGGCSSLKSVIIPDSVETLGRFVFDSCTALESATIGSGLTTLTSSTFRNCSSLKSLIIPDNITHIGNEALDGCSSLEFVIFGTNVETIGDWWSSPNLKTLLFKGNGPHINSDNLSDVVATAYYPKSGDWTESDMQQFGGTITWAEYSCEDNNHVFLSEDDVCAACGNKNISWPITGTYEDEDIYTPGDLVTWTLTEDGTLTLASEGNGIVGDGGRSGNIGGIATYPWLEYQDKITSVVVEESVTEIEGPICQNCTNLTSVTLPESLTYMNYAFQGCSSLEEVKIPGGVEGFCNAFEGCSSLKSVELGDGLTHIDSFAFAGCQSLESIVLPGSVKGIDPCAFVNCTALKDITFGSGLRRINENAFYGCTSLEAIIIPDSVTYVASLAFKDCTSLKTVIIGSGVTTIYDNAFSNCTNLKTIVFTGDVPTIGETAFKNVTATAYIPRSYSKEWSNFKPEEYDGNIVTELYSCEAGDHVFLSNDVCFVCNWEFSWPITGTYEDEDNYGDDVTWTLTEDGTLTLASEGNGIIGDGGIGDIDDIATYPWLEYKEKVTSVIVEEGITEINGPICQNCTNVTSVSLPENLIYLNDAFAGCSSLEKVKIPGSVEDFSCAFYGCDSLKNVEIGDGVDDISIWAFMGCDSLESIVLPDSVQYICLQAFYRCTALKEISFGSGLTRIDMDAFYGCTSLDAITIPDSVTKIESRAFANCTNLKTVVFTGDAPTMDNDTFKGVTATAYYPDLEIWTEDVLQDYGGDIEWVKISNVEIETSATSNATVTAPAGGWMTGPNTFKVSSEEPCVVCYSNDGGQTYNRLTANATASENKYSFDIDNVTADTIISVGLLGDVNGDDVITNADVTSLKAAQLGKKKLDPLNMLWGDVNNSGGITNADITRLKAAQLGKIDLKW